MFVCSVFASLVLVMAVDAASLKKKAEDEKKKLELDELKQTLEAAAVDKKVNAHYKQLVLLCVGSLSCAGAASARGSWHLKRGILADHSAG